VQANERGTLEGLSQDALGSRCVRRVAGRFSGLTASGDIFEPYTEYTAASPYLPFGTDLLVTYGGNSVVVEVTDRGPYTGGRDIDLSALAAEEIGLTYTGVDYVDVQVLN
jgi:rare lipoprotein A